MSPAVIRYCAHCGEPRDAYPADNCCDERIRRNVTRQLRALARLASAPGHDPRMCSQCAEQDTGNDRYTLEHETLPDIRRAIRDIGMLAQSPAAFHVTPRQPKSHRMHEMRCTRCSDWCMTSPTS